MLSVERAEAGTNDCRVRYRRFVKELFYGFAFYGKKFGLMENKKWCWYNRSLRCISTIFIIQMMSKNDLKRL